MSSQPGGAIVMGTTGPLAGQRFELRTDALFIGADAQGNARVTSDAKALTIRCARVSAKDGKFRLEAVDGGSGLTLDGSPVGSTTIVLERMHVIGLGDKLGDFVFRRVTVPGAIPSTPPAAASAPAATPKAAATAAPAPPQAPVAKGTLLDSEGFAELHALGRATPPASQTPATPAASAPLGTMMDVGALGEVADPRQRKKDAGTAPASPAPAAPLGTMMDVGGLGEVADPRQRKKDAGAQAAEPPPATPAPPAKPLGTMFESGGLGEIADPRKRQAPTPPAAAPAVPSQPPAPPPSAAAPAAPAAPAKMPSGTQPRMPAATPPANADGPATLMMDNTSPPQGASPYQLRVVMPGIGLRTYVLKYGDNVVGRGDGCDVQVVDPENKLSRRHVNIIVSRDKIELVDLKGANGTFVDGKRVETAIVKPGVSFHLGPRQFDLVNR